MTDLMSPTEMGQAFGRAQSLLHPPKGSALTAAMVEQMGRSMRAALDDAPKGTTYDSGGGGHGSDDSSSVERAVEVLLEGGREDRAEKALVELDEATRDFLRAAGRLATLRQQWAFTNTRATAEDWSGGCLSCKRVVDKRNPNGTWTEVYRKESPAGSGVFVTVFADLCERCGRFNMANGFWPTVKMVERYLDDRNCRWTPREVRQAEAAAKAERKGRSR